MSKITTHTITTKPRHTGRKATRNERAESKHEQEQRTFNRWRRAEARQARAERQYTTRSDGVTRCSKCPPTRCCEDCAAINNARQVAGLIRPRGSPEPHPNNCLPCIPREQRYMGSRPYPPDRPATQIVNIEIEPLGGGWFRGVALLGMDEIYSKKCRGREAALTYARASMVCIRQGLDYEREHG
jgi:hypothetical protein